MPNFTNLPERHFVDKAKKLSFGDQDKDTYFDGETLDTMLKAISDLQEKVNKKRYLHSLTIGNKIHTVIVNDSSTKFTKDSLAEWLRQNDYTDDLLTGSKCYPTDVCINMIKREDHIISKYYYHNLIVSQSGTIQFKSDLFAIDGGFAFNIVDNAIKITTVVQPIVVPSPNWTNITNTVTDTVIEV